MVKIITRLYTFYQWCENPQNQFGTNVSDIRYEYLNDINLNALCFLWLEKQHALKSVAVVLVKRLFIDRLKSMVLYVSHQNKARAEVYQKVQRIKFNCFCTSYVNITFCSNRAQIHFQTWDNLFSDLSTNPLSPFCS